MDAQAVSALCPLDGHGVIQVLGVVPVDGDSHKVPEVQPSLRLFRKDHIRDIPDLLQHRLREFTRQVMGLHHRLYIHARLVQMADDADDLAAGILSSPAEIRDVNDHLVTVLRPHAVSRGDKDIPSDLRVIRQHKSVVLRLFIESDDLFVGVFQHRRDVPLSLPTGCRLSVDNQLHPVSVQGAAGILHGDKDIPVSALNSDKAEALRIARIDTGLLLRARQDVLSSAVCLDQPILLQGGQNLRQGVLLRSGNIHQHRQISSPHRAIILILHNGQNRLPPFQELFPALEPRLIACNMLFHWFSPPLFRLNLKAPLSPEAPVSSFIIPVLLNSEQMQEASRRMLPTL